MFGIIDTALSYERELIICTFLQDFSKGKGSSLPLTCNTTYCVFTLWGRTFDMFLKEIEPSGMTEANGISDSIQTCP